jgi:hypothetical protein
MKPAPFIALFLAAAIACTAARAEPPADADALRSGLSEMLSVLSFGSVSVADGPGQVTQSGNDVRMQLPLSGFVAPSGASLDVVAHPAANGAWDLTSMTLPSAGALGTSIDQVVSYTIARQAMHGRLDPKLVTPSALAADLGAITLQTASGNQTSEQAIERITLDGTISGQPGGRLDLLARDAAYNWHVVAREPGGLEADNLVRRLDGHVSVTGLDRDRGRRLMAAARAFSAVAKSSPGQTGLAPAARDGLRDMLDAADGLLTRFEADETLDGLKFNFGGSAGTLARMQWRVTGNAEDQQVNAGMDIALDELSLATLSADSAAFLPHRVMAKSVLAGIPAAALATLLRSAVAPGADPAALQRQAAALLAAPGARAAIDALVFDAGPLHVRASARFVPRADGEVGADIHISAAGVDALLAQMQGKPNARSVLPMAFLAKGMGRAQGDSIVWDIALGGGPLTVNGVPFGQPGGKTR